MTNLTLNIKCDDGELERAIRFLHNNDADIEDIKQHYFKDGVLDIDMSVIKDEHKRYYHMNGMAALFVTLKNSIDDATS